MAHYYHIRGVKEKASFIKQAIIAALMLITGLMLTMPSVKAAMTSTDFEAFTPGTVHGQFGWSSSGAAGSGCATYDHEVAGSLGTAGFGEQSLRISNAVTSGCFGDQTFSASVADAAGESTAENGTHSSAPVHDQFVASWDFASTTPGAEQEGLNVVASPDRGDGARMSWIQMVDTPTGLAVNFYDYQRGADDPDSCCSNFVYTEVASGLDRSVPHNIRVEMDLLEGESNDVVRVYIDDVLAHTGTSWEDYFRDHQGGNTRTVDSVLFRTSGTAEPDLLGNGFLIDNFSATTSQIPNAPETKEDCKKGGWMNFTDPHPFKNQGDCVSFVASQGRSDARR